MRRLTTVALATCLCIGPFAPSAAAAAEINLLANPGFESAAARWTCESGTAAAWGGHSGQYALTGNPTLASTAECAQVVPVRPGSSYTVSGWVRGGYAFLGSEFGGTWSPPTGQWTRLSVPFTTGPATTTVRVYVHGWYAQAAFEADDLVLAGPDSTGTVPAPPTDLAPSETTSHSVRLTWTGSPGAGRFRIYQDGTPRTTTTEPSVTLTGLTPGTSHTYAVSAVTTAGESPLSQPVTANTMPAQAAPPYAPRSLVATTPAPGQAWLAWEAVQTATDGYNVYRDGVRIAWSYGPATLVADIASGEHTFEVSALNSAGESPRSHPVTITT
ncbi:fibronectin type III domain-containing protein [Dactylosporangium sp. NPDC000521]|uniref:fibronectin type III domain-containing protein n=1 Tax=Dactylosporangium sp. NPDC000521 TaxID=3363975 RepID=UPI0036789AB1